jgi:hypothetical protein
MCQRRMKRNCGLLSVNANTHEQFCEEDKGTSEIEGLGFLMITAIAQRFYYQALDRLVVFNHQ